MAARIGSGLVLTPNLLEAGGGMTGPTGPSGLAAASVNPGPTASEARVGGKRSSLISKWS